MLADVVLFYCNLLLDEDAIMLLSISKQYPEIHPCLGIHPWYVHTESIEKIKTLIQENQSQIVGIGEIGLDFAKHLLEENSVKFEIYGIVI